jgi:hypothetical protein
MSSRPELLKKRMQNNMGKLNGQTLDGGGENGYYSFPSKPMPHGLLLQFKNYDYQRYVSGIEKVKDKNGDDLIRENSNLGFVPTLAQAFSSEGDNQQKPDLKQSTALELPFPRTLQDSQGIRIQQFERDFLYERIASGLASFDEGGGLSNMFGNITDTASQLLDSAVSYGKSAGKTANEQGIGTAMFEALKSGASAVGSFDSSKAAAMAGYLARNFISGEIAKSISVVGERVVNPQETLSFSGVDLRNFTFSWDLYPSNKKDTQNITNIIKLLKQKALPQVENAGAGGVTARAFLNYPSIVELNLLGVQEEHFMRFKRCMIQNVTADYGAGGMPEIIKGGVPAAVSLSITFMELQIHTAEDYGAENLGFGDENIAPDNPADSQGDLDG